MPFTFSFKRLRVGPFLNQNINFDMYALMLLVVFLPLKDFIEQYASFSGFNLIMPILILLILVSRIMLKGVDIHFNKVDWAFILLIMLAIISGLLSVITYGQFMNIIKDTAALMELFIVYLLGRSLTKGEFGQIVIWGVWEALLIASFGIYQYVAKVPVNQLWIVPSEDVVSRAFGSFQNPNGFASYLLIWFWLSIMISSRNKKYLAISAPLFLGIVFSLSRSAFAALVVGALLILFFMIPRKRNQASSFLPLTLFGRFKNIFDPTYLLYSAEAGRTWAINNVLHIIPNHIFWGVGMGMYGGSTAVENLSLVYLESIQHGNAATYVTDNQYLQILIQQGIMGALSFLYLLITMLVDIVRKAADNSWVHLIILVIVSCYFFQGLFENILFVPATAVMVWLIIGFGVSSEKSSNLI